MHSHIAFAARPAEHASCRFASAEDRRLLTAALVRDATRRNYKVLHLCPDDINAAARALARLDETVTDALARRQMGIKPAVGTYLRDGAFDPERILARLRDEHARALGEGYAGLSLTEDMTCAFSDPVAGGALGDYEARLDGLVPGAKPMRLGEYDHSTGRLGPVPSVLLSAHDIDLPPELAPLARQDPLAAAGELDFGCAAVLASVLDSHFHGPLSLGLDGLTHVDVTASRALRGRRGQPLAIHAAANRLKARCGSSARATTTERSPAAAESGMATTATREAGRPAGEGAHAAERGGGRRRLTDAEERRLVLAAKEGDEPRRAELVEAFMPLIAKVARAYRSSPSVDRRELMQAGVVGLLQSLERYDSSLGTPFWAYACWWVRQAMQQIVAQLTRPMVLSDRALRQLARVRNAERGHLQEKGREPSLPELAEATGIDLAHVECLACAERRARALQEPLSGDEAGGDTFGDLLRDPTAEDAYDRVPQQLLASELAALLGELSDREECILRGRFGIGGPERTLRELAGSLGVSAERVRQIEQHALDKLHDAVSR